MKWLDRILSYLIPNIPSYPFVNQDIHVINQCFDVVELYSQIRIHPNHSPSDKEINKMLMYQLIEEVSKQIEITSDSMCDKTHDRVITGQLFIAKRRRNEMV